MIFLLENFKKVKKMPKKDKAPTDDNEAVKNLLIISLLKDGVDPEIISIATGIAEATIRGKFPMKLIKKGGKKNE